MQQHQIKEEPAIVASTHRILVVDDDADVRDGLARALRRRDDFAVASAADSFEAGYQLAVHKPDLVILDIVMPGMGGMDICRRMRAKFDSDRLKIMILTGHPSDVVIGDSLVNGADLLLVKPQDVDTLLTHIDDLLGP